MPKASTKEPTNVAGPPPNAPTFPCKICGRKFVKDSLDKHVSACKILSKSRKQFESGKQRATGSDVTLNGVKKAQKELIKNDGHFPPPKTAWRERHEDLIGAIGHSNNGHFPPPKTAWRERHEDFIGAVSSAKGVDYALKTGTPLPPPPTAKVPSNYVQCEFCGRNFSKQAAERHVPFCKEQKSRGGPPAKNNAAKKALPPTRGGSAPTAPKTASKGRAGAPSPSRAGNRTAASPSTRAGGPRPSPSRAGKPSPSRKDHSSATHTEQRSGIPQPVRNTSAPPKTANSGLKKPGTMARGRSPAGRKK